MRHCFKSRIDHLEKLRLNHITVDAEILTKFLKKEDASSVFNQRFIVTINHSVTWKGGTVSLGNNQAYITLSKARMKQLKVDLGDVVEVCLEKDASLYGFDVPEEFEEILRQDVVARQRFESLSMGKRRAVIYVVLQIKSSDKRIEKSLFLLENLKRAPEGQETMRHMLGKDLP